MFPLQKVDTVASPQNLHIFCRVIDNFGDIGVCWRLARQLALEHALRVTLLVDDLASFKKICPAIDPARVQQQQSGVYIQSWTDNPDAATIEIADIVIEAFGCALPAAYVDVMANRSVRARQPVWINLEYLSAEAWVEGCHAMPSHYPSRPLIKYFFFPGFTARTGGLLRENDLLARRATFQENLANADAFLEGLGVIRADDECVISLFCYPAAPVTALLETLQRDARPSLCLVPEGVATQAVSAFLGQPAGVGSSAQRGSLRLQVVPFLDQNDYDRLLWSCDVNFVRGEDSMVRAQWAGRPFVWQPYPQQDQAHRAKLNAFLDRFLDRSLEREATGMASEAEQALTALWAAWNADTEGDIPWSAYRDGLPMLQERQAQWIRQQLAHGDLASNLVRFAGTIG